MCTYNKLVLLFSTCGRKEEGPYPLDVPCSSFTTISSLFSGNCVHRLSLIPPSFPACSQRKQIKSWPLWMEREHTVENISSLPNQTAAWPYILFPSINLFFSLTLSVSLKCSQCMLSNKNYTHSANQPGAMFLIIHKLQKRTKSSSETTDGGMCEGQTASTWGEKNMKNMISNQNKSCKVVQSLQIMSVQSNQIIAFS